ncbi:tRNA-nucleotidyltransferase, putative [Giardia lamblia P15]|uniref:tRNA-nucleotidyltransferase, putative n=1 Tax=Giardia intestinalis (strain P15) TaxID=658858 RepID=E1F7W6_GIAIA|nr:tRNA-nucleotidyltransferase, putative [Giardia lamblia P15]
MASEPCSKNQQLSTSIRVTENEAHLFDTLLAALASVNKHDTTLRVAGGWVRDKLLGYESHDIDIAIDNMTGVELGTIINEYIMSQGETVHKMGVVSQNPEKSKHLETACITVCGYDVDLVNLRAESYQKTSRVPNATKFGSPHEDALRRDFTVNALFYNINTREIEDFTGQGLADLKSRLIRTPLDCNITFYDDPLRILRAIRFSKRLGFELDKKMYRATESKELTARLQIVSRQRYNKELIEILSGEAALCGLRGLFDMHIFEEIFLHILNTSMNKELNVHSIYHRTVEIWKMYSTAMQKIREKLCVDALKIDLDTLYYFISLFSVGLAINEALLDHDALTSVADVSIAVRFLDEPIKGNQTHKTMPIMWYIARVCCASTNTVAETLSDAHMYRASFELKELAPEEHILLFRRYNKHAVLLSFCTLALTPHFENLLTTYGLDNSTHLLTLLDTKLNVDVPKLALLCGIKDKQRFRCVKDAAILCYLSDNVLLESLKVHNALRPEFTFEYCRNKLDDILKILQNMQSDRSDMPTDK